MIVAACVALFNPASLLYAQCYLVSALLNGSQSPLEIVRQQPTSIPLQANVHPSEVHTKLQTPLQTERQTELRNANVAGHGDLTTLSLEIK